jgi:hypothetical protein
VAASGRSFTPVIRWAATALIQQRAELDPGRLQQA